MVAHRQLGDQRHRHQPRHLRDGRDRIGQRTAGHEPVVQGAVDAELERAGPVQPSDTEQQVEDGQGLGQRQQQRRNPGAEHGQTQVRRANRGGRAAGRSAATARRRAPRQARPRPRGGARPAEFAGQRFDKDRERSGGPALARKSGAAQAGQARPSRRKNGRRALSSCGNPRRDRFNDAAISSRDGGATAGVHRSHGSRPSPGRRKMLLW